MTAAHLALFLKARWEGSLQGKNATGFEASPRGMKSVKPRVLLEPRTAAMLDEMQKRALKDTAEFAKNTGMPLAARRSARCSAF